MQKLYWEKVSKNYDEEIFDVYANDRTGIIESGVIKYSSPKNTVCDIGCAVGKWLPLLSAHYKKVFAVDISEQNIEQAKENHSSDNSDPVSTRGCGLPGTPLQYGALKVSIAAKVIYEKGRPSQIPGLHGDVRLRALVSDPFDPARAEGRNLFELPSVLHGPAEIRGRRGPRREIHQEIRRRLLRQEGSCQESARQSLAGVKRTLTALALRKGFAKLDRQRKSLTVQFSFYEPIAAPCPTASRMTPPDCCTRPVNTFEA